MKGQIKQRSNQTKGQNKRIADFLDLVTGIRNKARNEGNSSLALERCKESRYTAETAERDEAGKVMPGCLEALKIPNRIRH